MTQVNDNINSRAGKHLSYEECVKIEGYKELGYSNRKIARILNRAPQTINNAVNQGTVQLKLTINLTFVIVRIVDDVQSG